MLRTLSYLVLALGGAFLWYLSTSRSSCSHTMSCMANGIGEAAAVLAAGLLAAVIASVVNLVAFLMHRASASAWRKVELGVFQLPLLLFLLMAAAFFQII